MRSFLISSLIPLPLAPVSGAWEKGGKKKKEPFPVVIQEDKNAASGGLDARRGRSSGKEAFTQG